MYAFIFDIGKTNIKGHVLDHLGDSVWSSSTRNICQLTGDYPSIDVEGIWTWLQHTLQVATEAFPIEVINVSTHGACAVLLDQQGELLLPVMDYEVESLEAQGEEYEDVRPSYDDTLSPDLAGGLNLGRQLWWLRRQYPDRFSELKHILFYPQYWVWKLTGVAVSEVTSLGCHTDLWQPITESYSLLVDVLDIKHTLAPVVENYTPVAPVSTDLARALGLAENCMVYPGVHDSNAGLARYLSSDLHAPFNVISAGTWVVSMAVGGDSSTLRDSYDMLANVDVCGKPVACARFMGGREFELICGLANTSSFEEISLETIEATIGSKVFALPPFEKGSGPFHLGAKRGQITGHAKYGKSLATLYLALMIDYELDLLQAKGPVLFGNTSQKNPHLCRLLAQLRPDQPILMSNDAASTIKGAWCLTRWCQPMPESFRQFNTASATEIAGLSAYKGSWRDNAQRQLQQVG